MRARTEKKWIEVRICDKICYVTSETFDIASALAANSAGEEKSLSELHPDGFVVQFTWMGVRAKQHAVGLLTKRPKMLEAMPPPKHRKSD